MEVENKDDQSYDKSRKKAYPVKNLKKIMVKNAFQKIECPFFKKKKRSKKSTMRSEMERSRTHYTFLECFFSFKKGHSIFWKAFYVVPKK